MQIESGVSTITQVRTAVNASLAAANIVSASGTSGTTVTTASAVHLAGGVTAGGLVRNTKLGLDTANYVVINSSTGTQISEPQLAITRGGTGLSITPANQSPGDVIQVNSGSTGLIVGPPLGVAAPLRVFTYSRFT